MQFEVVRCVDRNFQIGDATEAVTADRPAGSLAFAQRGKIRHLGQWTAVQLGSPGHYALHREDTLTFKVVTRCSPTYCIGCSVGMIAP